MKKLFFIFKLVLLAGMLLSLSGCLPIIFAGVAGSGIELAKDRTTDEALKDTKIANAIKLNFIDQGFSALYAKIKINVIKGRVLLTGAIEKPEYARKAVEICWELEGVVEVIDELKIDKRSRNFNLAQYTRDSLITSQIKSAIFVDQTIKFVNYTVITENDIVYIFGIARSQEELEKVAKIAADIRGVQKVVSHAFVDAEAARKARLQKSKNKSHSKKRAQEDDEDEDDYDDS
jgi:osmotically-inducible protein OsmY